MKKHDIFYIIYKVHIDLEEFNKFKVMQLND